MTEYIYISSDVPLMEGAIGDKGIEIFDLVKIYIRAQDEESFYFESNEDANENDSFSKYFISKKHQVCSIVLTLPEEGAKRVSKENKKALSELLGYIKYHFNTTSATYMEILFSLNSYENEPLKTEGNGGL